MRHDLTHSSKSVALFFSMSMQCNALQAGRGAQEGKRARGQEAIIVDAVVRDDMIAGHILGGEGGREEPFIVRCWIPRFGPSGSGRMTE